MTSSQYGPYAEGNTRATIPATKRRKTVRWSKSQKADLSSDCGLQLDHMKLELLVMASQQHRREYVPGSCTHRPSRHESWLYPKSVIKPQG